MPLSPSVKTWADPRVFLPLGVLPFIFHLIFSSTFPNSQFEDPGIGWHLKSGELILEKGRMLQTDPFTWTFSDKEWIQFEWLSDVLFAALVQTGGLPLLSATMALLFGLILYLLCWRMLSDEIHPMIACSLSLVAFLVLSQHALARPHVFTYLFLVILFWLLDRYRDRGGIRYLWPMILLMIPWCNLHGGFVSGLLLIFLAFCGYVIEALADRDIAQEMRSRIPPIMITGILCGVATLINPYGWVLHWHIIEVLGMDCLRLWNEFKPTRLGLSNIHLICFQVMLIGFLVLAVLKIRKVRWDERLMLLVITYFAFQAVRHVNLLILLITPLLALQLQSLLKRVSSQWAQQGSELARLQCQTPVSWITVAVLTAMFWLSSVFWQPTWHGSRLTDRYLHPDTIRYLSESKAQFQRPFNNNSLGGSLTYHFYPELRIFMDDRADVYQDDFVFHTYLPISQTRDGWHQRLLALDVDSMVLKRNDTLATAALAHPEWKLVHENPQNRLFLRVQNSQ